MTLLGDNDTLIPLGMRSVRDTLPLNPPMLDTLTMALPDDPAGTVNVVGLTEIEKSGSMLRTVTVMEATPIVPRASVATMWTM